MNDLISRQAAIDAISCDITVTGRQNAEVVAATIGAFADRIKALPSAQPDVPDTNVGDMISRQAAIDAVIKRDANCGIDSAEVLKALPSAQPQYKADEWCTDCKEYDKERHCCPRWNRVIRQTLKNAQPEIIYCKDCKWKNRHYCTRAVEVFIDDDKYCAWAERRTDGVFNQQTSGKGK